MTEPPRPNAVGGEITTFRPPTPATPLTVQQEAVAKCLARGLSVKRIEAVTGMDDSTIRYHIGRIAILLGPPNEDEAELSERDRVFAWAYWTFKDAAA